MDIQEIHENANASMHFKLCKRKTESAHADSHVVFDKAMTSTLDYLKNELLLSFLLSNYCLSDFLSFQLFEIVYSYFG